MASVPIHIILSEHIFALKYILILIFNLKVKVKKWNILKLLKQMAQLDFSLFSSLLVSHRISWERIKSWKLPKDRKKHFPVSYKTSENYNDIFI